MVVNRGGFRGGCGETSPLFFISLAFFNRFEEKQIVLAEAELIISNATLTYFYPNPPEICLTTNHILFGRQLLYSPIIFPKHDLQLGI